MPRILLAWELGAGLGHLMQMLPLAQALAQRGHKIFLALRNLSRAQNLFPPDVATLLQAPFRNRLPDVQFTPTFTFAHILHNIGFEHDHELLALCRAWRTLYDLVQPDLVLFDHSPTALLAARGHSFRKVPLGSGFCIPPDQHPLPNLRPWNHADAHALGEHEDQILARMNRVLVEFSAPPLDHITQLYAEVDENLLLTFSELDHYPDRKDGEYRGIWTTGHRKAPRWPDGAGPRIFAYLKNFPALSDLLDELHKLRLPTLIVPDGIDPAIVKKFSSPALRFEHEPVDLAQAGRACDFAILNAGHGSTAEILLCGKPILQIPIYLEQGLISRASIRRLGAGKEASHKAARGIRDALHSLMSDDHCAIAARSFGEKYASFDPEKARNHILSLLESLLAPPASPAPRP